jgi:hypothetical protein
MMILGSGSRRRCRLGRNDGLLFIPPRRGGWTRTRVGASRRPSTGSARPGGEPPNVPTRLARDARKPPSPAGRDKPFPLSVFPDPFFQTAVRILAGETPRGLRASSPRDEGRWSAARRIQWRRVRDAAEATLAKRGGRPAKRRPRLTALHSGGGTTSARSAAAFVDTPGPRFGYARD